MRACGRSTGCWASQVRGWLLQHAQRWRCGCHASSKASPAVTRALAALPAADPVADVEMADDEMPERRNQVAPEVIQRRLAARSQPAQQQGKAQQAAALPAAKAAAAAAHAASAASSPAASPRHHGQQQAPRAQPEQQQLSELEQAEQRRQRARLAAERERLMYQVRA